MPTLERPVFWGEWSRPNQAGRFSCFPPATTSGKLMQSSHGAEPDLWRWNPRGLFLPQRRATALELLKPTPQPAVSPITGSTHQPGDREITVKDNQNNIIAAPTVPESPESPAPVVGLSHGTARASIQQTWGKTTPTTANWQPAKPPTSRPSACR